MGGTLFNNAAKATGQPIRPSTPIPQNVQAKYAQQPFAPATMPPSSYGQGGKGAGLNIASFLGLAPQQGQPPQKQGNAGYIQPPVLPSMINPAVVNNAAPAPQPVVNQPLSFKYTPPPPPAPVAEEKKPEDEGSMPKYSAEGSELYYGWKKGGLVKNTTDDVDRALQVVRNVVKKDKK